MAGVDFIKVTPGKTMRVRITADTRVLGQHLPEGKVVELAEEHGHNLIIAHKAVRVGGN